MSDFVSSDWVSDSVCGLVLGVGVGVGVGVCVCVYVVVGVSVGVGVGGSFVGSGVDSDSWWVPV